MSERECVKTKAKIIIIRDLASSIAQWEYEHESSSIIIMENTYDGITEPFLQTLLADTTLKDIVVHHRSEMIRYPNYIAGEKRVAW